MTPVQELFEKLWDTPKDKFTWYAIRRQLLEKEKEVIINAFINGDNSDCLQEQDSRLFAEEYYNETFNTK